VHELETHLAEQRCAYFDLRPAKTPVGRVDPVTHGLDVRQLTVEILGLSGAAKTEKRAPN
jgi:hypothetical protein